MQVLFRNIFPMGQKCHVSTLFLSHVIIPQENFSVDSCCSCCAPSPLVFAYTDRCFTRPIRKAVDMGTGASKAAFRDVLSELDSRDIAQDDTAFWEQIWKTSATPYVSTQEAAGGVHSSFLWGNAGWMRCVHLCLADSPFALVIATQYMYVRYIRSCALVCVSSRFSWASCRLSVLQYVVSPHHYLIENERVSLCSRQKTHNTVKPILKVSRTAKRATMCMPRGWILRCWLLRLHWVPSACNASHLLLEHSKRWIFQTSVYFNKSKERRGHTFPRLD